jgi:DNA replication protein DnaD
VTADTTSNASIPYANSVLERWNAAGLRTLDDIERSYQQKDKSAIDSSSFDTDSFFAAAVRRALGDD